MDKQGREEARKVVSDFLQFAERVQQESDARCAESGEIPKPILVGYNLENPTLVVLDLAEEAAGQNDHQGEP